VPPDRRALGDHGEALAASWYQARGFVVVARNWRGRGGEVDVVVRRGRLVVFCEVKARTTDVYGSGADAVGRVKRSRVRRVAAEWLAATRPGPVDVRFDVAVVRRGLELEIIEAAF
jgi:putative endonuclease